MVSTANFKADIPVNVDEVRSAASKPIALRIKCGETRGSTQSSRISTWVNKLEKINTNPGEHPHVHYHHDLSEDDCSNSHQKLSCDSDDDTTLCFKTIQLGTEFCLMLFAASLLIIAGIVIVSKKVPAFMETYENFPKFLFILCVIVAIWSFSRWVWLSLIASFKRYREKGMADELPTKEQLQTSVKEDLITVHHNGDKNDDVSRLHQDHNSSVNKVNDLNANSTNLMSSKYIYHPANNSSYQRPGLRWPSLSLLLSTKQVINESSDSCGEAAAE